MAGPGFRRTLRPCRHFRVFGTSAITAITAQNTEEVTAIFELPVSIIAAQIDAVFDDFDVAAVKTGMLSSAEIVKVVAKLLKPQAVTNLVVDPVMISKSGHRLLKPDAVEALMHELIPYTKLNNCPGLRSKPLPMLGKPPRSYTGWDVGTCWSREGTSWKTARPICSMTAVFLKSSSRSLLRAPILMAPDAPMPPRSRLTLHLANRSLRQ